MYFAKLPHSRPRPVKRPKSWASTDDQVEVFTQLCCMASNVSHVAMMCSRGIVTGSVGWPDPDTMRFSFAPLDRESLPPEPGEVVRIVAEGRLYHFEFCTSFAGLDEVDRWTLAGPDNIVTKDRRSTPRVERRGWHAILRRQGPSGLDVNARVIDLSIGGLSMLVAQDQYRLAPEKPLVGVLLGPTGERLPIRAQICHHKPWERSERAKILIGAIFDGFGVVNHARLARILAAQYTSRP